MTTTAQANLPIINYYLPSLKDAEVVDSTFLRNNWGHLTAKIANTLKPLIVQKRNEERFAIVDLDEYEDFLLSQNPDYVKSIKKSRDQYKKGNYISLEDMMRKIK